MAGISASDEIPGKDIVIIEKNRVLGRKVLATGNGKCNYSNTNCGWKDYSPGGRSLVRNIFEIFGPEQTLEYFKSMGIYPIVQEEGRIYPHSLEGSSFVQAMVDRLHLKEVDLLLNREVKALTRKDKFFEVKLERDTIVSEAVVLATGGKAGLRFGSTGDGYGFAKKLGHSLIPARPALVQVITEEGARERIKGVRAKAEVKLFRIDESDNKEEVIRERGEVQFFEEGLSGICIFQLSRYMEGNSKNYIISLDLFPDISEAELVNIFKDRKIALAGSQGEALLRTLIPDKLIAIYLKESGIMESERIAAVDESRIIELATLLKRRIHHVRATKGWVEAQVTAGGINNSEVNSNTLESKICPGLFFAGELLDVDGPCGGWNLQWAWSSGYVAGVSACKNY